MRILFDNLSGIWILVFILVIVYVVKFGMMVIIVIMNGYKNN